MQRKVLQKFNRKKGDIDSAIQTLEGAFSDTESEDICIELIGILKEHQEIAKSQTVCHSIKAKDGSCTGKCV